MCNTYIIFTATMVARTRFNVTLYVHCLSCINPIWHNPVSWNSIRCNRI